MPTDVLLQLNTYPLREGLKPTYGTAGFRSVADLLPSTVFRCGALMALRAGALRQVTGIVITASHNPEQDNGVKLVDPSGNMLDSQWENMADALAQATTAEQALREVELIKQTWAVGTGGTVMVAHDTRSSALDLCKAAAAGISAVGGTPEPALLLTTPQLHWMVARRNCCLPFSEVDYFQTLLGAFEQLRSSHCPSAKAQALVVDAANGVGAPKLAEAAGRLSDLGLNINVINSGTSGALNAGCGADFVQKEQARPAGFESIPSGMRCASMDGDADRLVYFVMRKSGHAQLFDGDRIAVLAATLLDRILHERPGADASVRMGIVQTAYANGSSTRYVRSRLTECEVVMTPTGVKHLHHAAAAFDIGIYYEANGHGTILFKPSFLKTLTEGSGGWRTEMGLLSQVMNQAVGDALSGLLLVEYALCRLGWGLAQWTDLYTDLPSRQLKVAVPNRAAFTTTDAETRLMTPRGLQCQVEAEVAKVSQGRCFVRPSGTEDVVRVYAEAENQIAADQLAKAVASLVSEMA
ncbi:hypothetical protein WJX84_003574 [Apatococcus fuscideae]|uniref:Phosphoacetylglucosamine mutase n=1 Tax=Apatococcus fuscideae TaxID=2026836 RepID=A0AAW1SY18_9CHLO